MREKKPRSNVVKAGIPEPAGETDRRLEKAKKRHVGALDGNVVYFVGSRMGFHLAIECTPGVLRRLSEEEHLRFRLQSRIDGLDYESP